MKKIIENVYCTVNKRNHAVCLVQSGRDSMNIDIKVKKGDPISRQEKAEFKQELYKYAEEVVPQLRTIFEKFCDDPKSVLPDQINWANKKLNGDITKLCKNKKKILADLNPEKIKRKRINWNNTNTHSNTSITSVTSYGFYNTKLLFNQAFPKLGIAKTLKSSKFYSDEELKKELKKIENK